MIKVVYDNINKYTGTINQDRERIIEEINNLKASCEELSNVWKGYDADMFLNNMENYLNKMNNIPSSMEKISKFVSMSREQYKEEDELYARDLRREQLRYKTK